MGGDGEAGILIGWFIKRGWFKNANHAIWFICSVSMFLLVFAGWYFPKRSWLIILVPAIAHFPPLIKSSVVVLRKEANEIYNKDCIWFNILMIILYIILFESR